MRHLDLFSGIGGFAYAVDKVWPDAEHIFCDNDIFCQQVLKKHWPNSKIYGDIRTLTNTDRNGLQEPGAEQQAGGNRQLPKIDLLTGGFPCQPFSAAGQRKGEADDRYLWPEMLRVIKEFQPTWIIGENVAGIINMALEQVCSDLEAQGYEVWPLVIPACAVNAPHRRDRVWIIGYAKHNGLNGSKDGQSGNQGSDSNSEGKDEIRQPKGTDSLRNESTNSASKGLEGSKFKGKQRSGGRPATQNRRQQYSWDENWLEVATRFCGVDDGLPVELDGFKLTKAQHRVQRLKALGNSIVPQVVLEIMKQIPI